MQHIVSGVLSLTQYLLSFKEESGRYQLSRCLGCGKSGLWLHGCYARKADRSCMEANESLNPIFIQRFYCHFCRKTCSVLPECVAIRRWYLWIAQQIVLLHWLSGMSIYSIAKKSVPSRHTIRRWVNRFKEQFHLHKDAICNQLMDLGRTVDFKDFWQTFLKEKLLSHGMRICHAAGLAVP